MIQHVIKRIVDILLCIMALPFFALVMLVVGPKIYLEDRGSIFYNAPRLGKNGRVFKMYKLRSMKRNAPDLRNADGSTFNSDEDPRLLKIGKFIRQTSIDELPQILNVIKGDMSIIGPRPDLPEHYELYENNESRKLEMRPGLTGYNQAYFRNTIPWKERIQNDIYYISHFSLWFDTKIFFKTIISVVRRKDIYITAPDQHL